MYVNKIVNVIAVGWVRFTADYEKGQPNDNNQIKEEICRYEAYVFICHLM